MTVVIIIGILAAIAVPMMQGRIDSAKWSEAHAAAGTIAACIRAYVAARGPTYSGYGADLIGDVTVFGPHLGIEPGDLQGTYFAPTSYQISSIAVPGAGGGAVDFVVTVTPVNGLSGSTATGSPRALDQNGVWR